jgi:hypothetical protein
MRWEEGTMTYEEARRHLDPVRDYFEARGHLRISTAYHGKKHGESSAVINTDAEFIGAYLRDDKLVVMFKFDDSTVDPFHIDLAYEAIRQRIKGILPNIFPGLALKDIAVHVMDTTGNLGDFEY